MRFMCGGWDPTNQPKWRDWQTSGRTHGRTHKPNAPSKPGVEFGYIISTEGWFCCCSGVIKCLLGLQYLFGICCLDGRRRMIVVGFLGHYDNTSAQNVEYSGLMYVNASVSQAIAS